MSTRPTQGSNAGRVYLALRKKAIAEGRATDEYLQTHALESFVERLAASESAGNFTLKGGVLLSAFHVRRPTLTWTSLRMASRTISSRSQPSSRTSRAWSVTTAGSSS
ncbi:MAG: hypothetical protein RLZZ450_862 [Pseudomonadota bacterium]